MEMSLTTGADRDWMEPAPTSIAAGAARRPPAVAMRGVKPACERRLGGDCADVSRSPDKIPAPASAYERGGSHRARRGATAPIWDRPSGRGAGRGVRPPGRPTAAATSTTAAGVRRRLRRTGQPARARCPRKCLELSSETRACESLRELNRSAEIQENPRSAGRALHIPPPPYACSRQTARGLRWHSPDPAPL